MPDMRSSNGPLRVGVGGPVGSGKTSLMDALCKRLRDRYDIAAKLPPDVTWEEMQIMMQSLLAARFQLQTHRESKDLPMYALVVAKSGSRLHPSEPGRNSFSRARASMVPSALASWEKTMRWALRSLNQAGRPLAGDCAMSWNIRCLTKAASAGALIANSATKSALQAMERR